MKGLTHEEMAEQLQAYFEEEPAMFGYMHVDEEDGMIPIAQKFVISALDLKMARDDYQIKGSFAVEVGEAFSGIFLNGQVTACTPFTITACDQTNEQRRLVGYEFSVSTKVRTASDAVWHGR